MSGNFLASEPEKTIIFETKGERDAFVKGILWERDEYPADIVCNPPIGGKYRVELFRIQDAKSEAVA